MCMHIKLKIINYVVALKNTRRVDEYRFPLNHFLSVHKLMFVPTIKSLYTQYLFFNSLIKTVIISWL
jgi:hypothetical protein